MKKISIKELCKLYEAFHSYIYHVDELSRLKRVDKEATYAIITQELDVIKSYLGTLYSNGEWREICKAIPNAFHNHNEGARNMLKGVFNISEPWPE
jgi:hypothetical protein